MFTELLSEVLTKLDLSTLSVNVGFVKSLSLEFISLYSELVLTLLRQYLRAIDIELISV